VNYSQPLGVLFLMLSIYLFIFVYIKHEYNLVVGILGGLSIYLTLKSAWMNFFLMLLFFGMTCITNRIKKGYKFALSLFYILFFLFIWEWKFSEAITIKTSFWMYVVLILYPFTLLLLYKYFNMKKDVVNKYFSIIALVCIAFTLIHLFQFLFRYIHPEVINYSAVELSSSSTLIGSFIKDAKLDTILFDLSLFIQTIIYTSSVPIFSFFILYMVTKNNYKLLLLSYPLLFFFIFGIYGRSEYMSAYLSNHPININPLSSPIFVPGLKFPLSIQPFIIISASFVINTISNSLGKTNIIIKIKLKLNKQLHYPHVAINLRSTLFIICIFVFISYHFYEYNQLYVNDYGTVNNRGFGFGFLRTYKPAFEYIQQETPADAVLMARKCREVAWYTDRPTVWLRKPGLIPLYGDVPLENLTKLIVEFRVNYLIIGSNSQQNLRELFKQPRLIPEYYEYILWEESNIGFVMLLNVTKLWSPGYGVS